MDISPDSLDVFLEKIQFTESEVKLGPIPGWWDECDEFTNRCLIMTDEQVLKRLMTIICGQFSITSDSVSLETNFMDDLDADSLDIVEMMLRCEEAFLVPIRDDDTILLNTVGDVYEYIKYGLKLKVQRVKERIRIKLQRKRLRRLAQGNLYTLDEIKRDYEKLLMMFEDLREKEIVNYK